MPLRPGRTRADEVDGAFVLLDDAASHPQTKSGAAFALGGVERRKQVLAHARRNAAAIVEHGNPDTLAARIRGQTRFVHVEKKLSARRHAVDGVGHEIGEDLPQFAGKSAHRAMRLEALVTLMPAIWICGEYRVSTLSRTLTMSTCTGDWASRWKVSSWPVIWVMRANSSLAISRYWRVSGLG